MNNYDDLNSFCDEYRIGFDPVNILAAFRCRTKRGEQ